MTNGKSGEWKSGSVEVQRSTAKFLMQCEKLRIPDVSIAKREESHLASCKAAVAAVESHSALRKATLAAAVPVTPGQGPAKIQNSLRGIL